MTSFECPPWKLAQRLGTGTLTEAFAADGPSGTAVIKRLLPYYAENELLSAAFILRGEEARALSHPAIIRVLATGTVGRDRFLVVERAGGRALSRVFSRLEQKGWPALPQVPVVACAYQAAKALAYAHSQGVLHLDVSLHNLYLAPTGHLSIADFGLGHARRSYAPDAGSADMVPPELWSAGTKPDARVDIWQLAAATWMLLAGGLPPNALTRGFPSLRERVDGADELLSELLMRALSPMPVERPLAMAEVVASLGNWLDRAGVTDAAAASKSLYRNVFFDDPADDSWSVPQVHPWPSASGTDHKVITGSESTPTSPKAIAQAPRRGRRWAIGAVVSASVIAAIVYFGTIYGSVMQAVPLVPDEGVHVKAPVVAPPPVQVAAETPPSKVDPVLEAPTKLPLSAKGAPAQFVVSSERHGFFADRGEGLLVPAQAGDELVVGGTTNVPVLRGDKGVPNGPFAEEKGSFLFIISGDGRRTLQFIPDSVKLPEDTKEVRAGFFTDRVMARTHGQGDLGVHRGGVKISSLQLARSPSIHLDKGERFTLTGLSAETTYQVEVSGDADRDGVLMVARIPGHAWDAPVLEGPARGITGQWLLAPAGSYLITGADSLLFSMPRLMGKDEVRFEVKVHARATALEKVQERRVGPVVP